MGVLSKFGLQQKFAGFRPLSSGSHRIMEIFPSNWTTRKTFDIIHFYVCLTGLPLLAWVLYCQIVIGPAVLTEIPEGYIPEEYEYYKSPIGRKLIKMSGQNFARDYEREFEFIENKFETMKWRWAKQLFRDMNRTNRDTTYLYHVPYDTRYVDKSLAKDRSFEESRGDDYGRLHR